MGSYNRMQTYVCTCAVFLGTEFARDNCELLPSIHSPEDKADTRGKARLREDQSLTQAVL